MPARKKPTTATIALWNVTGSVSITTHADEAHKPVALVDVTVKLGDTETAHDLVTGLCKVMEFDENVHDFLRHIIIHTDKLKKMAREWRADEHLAEAAARNAASFIKSQGSW